MEQESMEQERTLIWHKLLTRVWLYDDGSLEVNTPTSIQKGFNCQQDAIDYAETWGRIDRRV